MIFLMLGFMPFSIWLLLRMMREFKPPLSVNFARAVVLSLKDLYRMKGVKDYKRFLEVVEEKKKILDLWFEIHRFPARVHREMAINHLFLSEYDQAIHHFKHYLEDFTPKKIKTDRQLEVVPFLSSGVSKTLFKKYRSFNKKNIRLLEENFTHLEYLRPAKAIENFEEAKKEAFTADLDFVYSLFLEMLCRQYNAYSSLLPEKQKELFSRESVTTKRNQQWQATITSLLAHPDEYRRESLGDSLNIVFEISNKEYFRDAFVLKGHRERENLVNEQRNTEAIRRIVTNFPGFLAPVPLHITGVPIPFQKESIFVYTMRRSRGTPVLDYIKGNRQLDILDVVAEYLALIHTRMPGNFHKIDFRAKLRGKFDDMDMVEPQIKESVLESIVPVIKSFENAVFVFGKDAHPGNWLVTEQREIVALDMEDKGAVPVEIDLVNLLEFTSFGLNRGEREVMKQRIIRLYEKHFQKYGCDRVDEPVSMLRYFNAVIQRMLCLYCFWSQRESSTRKKIFILNNALFSIKEIARLFNVYFSTHRHHYTSLEKAIIQLKALPAM
ncbi:MAG: hypothetical protein GY757_23950 [bacterium]|nr:hypothetical protein [bacterium]